MEDARVIELVQKFGSPLYFIDEARLRLNYRTLKKSLDAMYEPNNISYSIKTNYLPAIVSVLKNEGASAEIVSGFEYWLARQLGFGAGKIVFNGPQKTKKDLVLALKEGAMVNIDNLEELLRACKIAQEQRMDSLAVGLRVHVNAGSSRIERFGFNVEDGEVFEALQQAEKIGCKVVVRGLQAHIGSNIRQPARYERLAEKMSDCALTLEKTTGAKIEYLDFGGGFPADPSRSLQPDLEAPSIGLYLTAIAAVLKRKFPSSSCPRLCIEPGRYLVDTAAMLAATVVSSKTRTLMPGRLGISSRKGRKGRTAAQPARKVQVVTADTSRGAFLRYLTRRDHIRAIPVPRDAETLIIPTMVVGNTCMSRDILTPVLPLPALREGDTLLFQNTGAYTFSRSEQFIHPRPAAVLCRENGEAVLIRKREEYGDMVALDEPLGL